MPHNPIQGEIGSMIRSLWYPSDYERKKSIEQISKSGPAAIRPLISVLSDLIIDQYPRFSPGREKEGNIALQEYIVALRAHSKEIRKSYLEIEKKWSQVSTIAINSRLMSDIVYLLGELKAEQAIPVLVELLHKQITVRASGAEVDALLRIGDAAVPQLINYLEEARIRGLGFETVVYGWSVVVKSDDGETDKYNDSEQRGDNQKILARTTLENRRINVTRRKILWILGEIGDKRAIPVLEGLSNTIDDKSLIVTIQGTISKIRKTKADSPETRSVSPRRFSPKLPR